ncbi:SemiSWEET transporter [Candidatus Parcubacteria bacterium]|jgi:MtN3 and saliva related transmembrane protein|nr:SemiSWEET transporter [Candidatus Parcubacteria bacterium]MBT3949341.1 SemiSWEET transporter [Candidatus Parcubacteria bacterium]
MAQYIGLFAAVLTTSSLLPQLIKLYKTKKTRDVSLAWTIMLTVGIFFWFIYGLMVKDIPLIFANTTGLILSGAVLVGKLIYKKYEQKI